MVPLYETPTPFPTVHVTCFKQTVPSLLPPVNVPLGPGDAGVTGHEQAGAGGRLVEGAIPCR